MTWLARHWPVQEAVSWTQDLETAMVWNTVAVPVDAAR